MLAVAGYFLKENAGGESIKGVCICDIKLTQQFTKQ